MPPKYYRRKEPEIEAIQFTGRNDNEIRAFVGPFGEDPVTTYPSWLVMGMYGNKHEARVSDWIIRPIHTTVCHYTVMDSSSFEKFFEEAS